MDILSQGLAGAVIASSLAKPQQIRIAAAIGFFAGLLADVDVLIRSAEDPLLFLDFHRHFTHSLVFVPIGGLLAALVMWPFARRWLPFSSIYLFSVLGYLPSGLLDACTSYGTHLLWPFDDSRVAWSVISIIDPVFTLILLFGMGWAMSRRSPRAAHVALALSLMYLLLGMAQHERAEGVARELAAKRGHVVNRIAVHPSLGNILLWRSVYESQDRYFIDGVRVGWLDPPRIYEGGSIQRFTPQALTGLQSHSVLASDIERFTRFSDGFVALHPDNPNVLGDVRYALLPNSILPLWGISLNLAQQDRHVEFVTFRQHDGARRQAFMDMLAGNPLAENN